MTHEHCPEPRGLSPATIKRLSATSLRREDLEQSYADAFAAWEASGERDQWDAAVADGLSDAPR